MLWQTANMGPKAAGLNAQRRKGEERDENPTVHSAPHQLKHNAGHNAGHNHDRDPDSVVLVSVVGISNATSLGQLSLAKNYF